MDEWSQEKVCKIPSFLLRAAGHGPVTGRCVATDRARLAARGVTVCEIQSWCPVEDDRIVKGSPTFLMEAIKVEKMRNELK